MDAPRLAVMRMYAHLAEQDEEHAGEPDSIDPADDFWYGED